jgi:hypothetical protein
MPRRSLIVTPKNRTEALPQWANEYVVLVSELEARGVLRQIAERLRVARRGGYCGLDVFLFLLSYFSSGLNIGLRPFSRQCEPYARRLAAVAGRRLWPGSASVSRFLSSVKQEQVEAFGAWLLGEGVGAGALEAHPSIVCRDTRGESWHAFDYDPTVTTLRHRALPLGADLPDPERRSADMAAKGYPGRKRGDVQFSRATLQHAGSGLWLSLSMHPGNGDHRRDNERAILSARAWCERTGASHERAVLRSDGAAGGSVPAMTTCRDAGIHYVTRLWRYELLEHEQVKERLRRAIWLDVEDALSGPKREATELGTMLLSAGQRVMRDNGEPYASVETRLVASRMPLSDEAGKRGAGIAKDGWWYELFGTSVPAASWPAPETVSLYYGRSGQENRFYQEDRELGLDRIFSYNLAGQQLANLVGLFVWNLRVARGADLVAPMPDRLPVQSPRTHVQSSPPPLPEAASPLAAEPSPSATGDAPRAGPPSQVPAALMAEATTTTELALPVPLDIAAAGGSPCACAEIASAAGSGTPQEGELCGPSLPDALATLAAADWSAHLGHLPGWRWDEALGLVCPGAIPAHVHRITTAQNGTVSVRWRAKASACRDCLRRATCSNSPSPTFRKEVLMTFTHSESDAIAGLVARKTPAPVAHRAAVAKANSTGVNTSWRPTPQENDPGVLSVAWPILLPSELRHCFVSACGEAGIDITLQEGKRRSRTPFYFATDAAARQRRRKTWTWRREHNQLPDDAQLHIVVHGPPRLARALGAAAQALAAA